MKRLLSAGGALLALLAFPGASLPASSPEASEQLQTVKGRLVKDGDRTLLVTPKGTYMALESLALEALESETGEVTTLARLHAYRGEGFAMIYGPGRDPFKNLVQEDEKFKGTAEILTGGDRPMLRVTQPGPYFLKTFPVLETEALEQWEDGQSRIEAKTSPRATPVPALQQAPKDGEEPYEEFVHDVYGYVGSTEDYLITGRLCGRFLQYRGKNYFMLESCAKLYSQAPVTPEAPVKKYEQPTGPVPTQGVPAPGAGPANPGIGQNPPPYSSGPVQVPNTAPAPPKKKHKHGSSGGGTSGLLKEFGEGDDAPKSGGGGHKSGSGSKPSGGSTASSGGGSAGGGGGYGGGSSGGSTGYGGGKPSGGSSGGSSGGGGGYSGGGHSGGGGGGGGGGDY